MANQTQDVELRIRATNYSKKTTTEVADALKELAKAQEAQRQAAEKGEATVADLEKSYTRMESAVRALLSQQALIKFFEQQSQVLADTEARLEAARKAQKDYSDSLDPAAKRTKEQTAELKRLGKEVTSAERAYDRIQASVNNTTNRMDAFGIKAATVADSQKTIAEAVDLANASLAKQEAAIDGADAAAKSRREAQARLDERHAQVKAEVVFNNAVRAAAQAQEQEAKAAREATEAAAMRDVQHEADLEALFTREANKRTAAVEKQAKAMRDAADAAERQMRASGSAATAGTGPVSTPSVRQQVQDIADPNSAAIRTVDGLTEAMGRLEARVTAVRGPVRDYRGAVQDAAAAQRSLAQIAGQLDTFNGQIAAVRAARQEYVTARAAVAALVTEMRNGGGGDDITSRLRAAQNTLDRAAASFNNVSGRARETQASLRAAGIDTRNLTEAQDRLVAEAGRGASAMSQLADQVRRYGQASNDANEGGRTTLSFFQRMRGELLSLIATYVGLQATIGLGGKVIDTFNENQGIMSRLLVENNGNAKAAGDEFKYLQEQADRIGINFAKTAPAFAKFAISAKQAGMNTQETRFIFENFAKTAATLNLTGADTERVFKAIEQMFNKGKVQAEELTQQLGDVLPGAVQIFAKAQGVAVEDFQKMMEKGQVGANILVAVARQLGDAYAGVNDGTVKLAAAQARFENAINKFLTDIGNSGFIDAYQGLLDRLTTFLNDGSAGKLGKLIADGLTLAINAIQIFVDNLETIKVVMGAILALKFLSFLTTLPTLFTAAIAPITAWNAAMLAANTQLGAFTAASAIAGTQATGFAALMARLAPAIMGVGSALLFVARALPVIGAAVAAYQVTTAILDKLDDNVRQTVVKSIAATDKAVADAEKAAAARDKARGTEKEKETQAEYDRLRDIAVKAIKAQDAALQTAKDKGVDLTSIIKPKAPAAAATADPGDLHSDANALRALKGELAKEDAKLDAAIKHQRLKSAKEELDERLKIVDEEYQTRRDAAKATIKDADTLAKAMTEIDQRASKARLAETMKFNNEQAKLGTAEAERRKKLAEDLNAMIFDLQAKLAKDLAQQKGLQIPIEDQLKAAEDAVQKTFTEIEKKIRSLAATGPAGASMAKTMMAQLEPLKEQAKQIAATNVYRERANELNDAFTKKQEIQKIQLDEINAKYEQGQITLTERTAEMNRVVAETGPALQAAGQTALDFLEKSRAMLDPVMYERMTAAIKNGVTKANVDATTAANNFALTQTQLNTVLQQQAADIERIDTMRKLGMISSEEQAAMLNEQQTMYQEKILSITQSLREQLDTQFALGTISAESYQKQINGIDQLALATANAQQVTTQLEDTIVNSLANNGLTAFEKLGEAVGRVATGADSIGKGFRNALTAVGQFFASLLRDIALAIAKQLILNAIASWGGGIGAGAVKLGGVVAGGKHTGGMVGQYSTFSRRVDPAIFASAARYHTGGMAGLQPDEVPAILQKGEEVITRDDPRNRMNGGMAGGDSGAGIRMVLVDDRSSVPEAMSGSDGDRVIVQAIRRNAASIKQMIK
jgi:tape measure domain-containing protein